MANELRNARDGLAELLRKTGVRRVYTYPPPGGPSEYPSIAFIRWNRRPHELMGGSTFVGTIDAVLYVSKDVSEEAYDTLVTYMEPAGGHSIEAAVDDDLTWRGTVDTGKLVRIQNGGYREVMGGSFVVVDLVFEFVKAVSA